MTVGMWLETPFTLSLHTPDVHYHVPFVLVHPDTSDVRTIALVLASEYRRVLLDDGARLAG